MVSRMMIKPEAKELANKAPSLWVVWCASGKVVDCDLPGRTVRH